MEKKIKILLVEDDNNLGFLTKEYLEAKEFEVVLKINGQEGIEAFDKDKFDICILDVMMPIKDGFTLAKEIRQKDTSTPIIFLTAKTLKDDVLNAFKLGADDYVTKPFSMEELLLRIKAILKRSSSQVNTSEEREIYQIGNMKFDVLKQLLIGSKIERKLTTKESDLLKMLCMNANKILDRNEALKSIWEDDSIFNARSMDVYITKLRKYLKNEPNVEIVNVHGKGYKLLINN